MNKYPKVSIIIPLYVISDRFFEDLIKFNNLDYPNFEILIVCDQKVALPRFKKIKARLILTGQSNTGPAEKRDIALKYAKGEFCAFIDDDAYPHPLWLKNAVPNFLDTSIVAVGGPGVTPPEDTYWGQMTGLVYGSFFCSGFAQYRFVKGKRQYVRDYPAYNLLIRKTALLKVGGYGNHFYGGEDTFLCLKLVKKGFKIFYDPNVLIFHHRRPLFVSYLKQIANVGRHRGYFARVFPQTSFTWEYFIPSILAISLIALIVLSPFQTWAQLLLFTLLPFFYLLAILSVINKTNILDALIVSTGIILTHMVYGLNFIQGYLTKQLLR
ncbi:MAG: glycosyltransferase [Patescibacteria group bacterium]